MTRYEVIIIGAGPAGLSAAIEAAAQGMQVVVFDDNAKPGGQLFKQIHKFFGSKENKAKERGFRIGEQLLEEAASLGVEVILNATVIGLFPDKRVTVMTGNQIRHYHANNILVATGAAENMVPFPGWTLPGVIGAGAAQTMMNINGLRPGKKILMVGSGNVGVVVGYQLLQAGCEVVAVIDAAPRIGGYGVHAAKIARMGVPFYTSHTIREAHGVNQVDGATIVQVDSSRQHVPGSEKFLEVDTICMAVGLSPMSQLARVAGCIMEDNPAKGSQVPTCNAYGETSVSGIFVAGDVAGIEEASSAMIQGRIAGAAIANAQGYLDDTEFMKRYTGYRKSLGQLREGMFGHGSKGRTDITHTEEGVQLSQSLLNRGYIDETEIDLFPGIPQTVRRKKGITPVIECTQNIPCNPCQDACPKGCIKVGNKITNLPTIDEDTTCTGCGMCVAACPGQAIFLVDENYAGGFAAVVIPYEIYPLPKKGMKGIAYDRSGNALGEAEVIDVRVFPVNDQTAVLTIKVPVGWSMRARFFKQ